MTRDASHLIQRCRALPELAMRVAIWREAFELRTVETLVHWIAEISASVDRRDADAQIAYLALIQFLERPEALDSARALHLAALSAGLDRVAELISPSGPARQVDSAHLRSAPVDKDREVTLGERRSMARGADRDRLDRLLFDQDPRVVQMLLSNPRITEADATRIAARRPNSAEVLRTVFGHPRYARSRMVQVALAQNPYTPTDVATGLLAVLDRQSILTLSQEPSVHPVVRARAEAMLAAPVLVSEAAEAVVWEIDLEAETPDEG